MIRSLRALAITGPLVFGPPMVAAALEYDPHILIVEFSDGMRIEVAATSPETCEAGRRAIQRNFWRLRDDGGSVSATWCVAGDRFAAGSTCIQSFNCPGDRR
jgi:hypothetical protein